jgi:hypothetical protein
METFNISFNALLLKRGMALWPDGFDDEMDGGEWCLKDFIRRAGDKGFHTSLTRASEVICGKETIFGSENRRREQFLASQDKYQERWGVNRHYTVYFGKDAALESLQDALEKIICRARQGNRFSLLLHRQQNILSIKNGWNSLHTGIEMIKLSPLLTQKDFIRKMKEIKIKEPETILVRGGEDITFPSADTTISFSSLTEDIKE